MALQELLAHNYSLQSSHYNCRSWRTPPEVRRIVDAFLARFKEELGSSACGASACAVLFNALQWHDAQQQQQQQQSRPPTSSLLPLAFAPDTVALTEINCISLVGVIRNGERGYAVLVGGGLSSVPRIARDLGVWIREDEAMPVMRALLDAWKDDLRYRLSRVKARMKFMVDDRGPEADLILGLVRGVHGDGGFQARADITQVAFELALAFLFRRVVLRAFEAH